MLRSDPVQAPSQDRSPAARVAPAAASAAIGNAMSGNRRIVIVEDIGNLPGC